MRAHYSFTVMVFLTGTLLLGTAPADVWTDATGKFQIEATFVKVEGGMVHLKRADNGQEIRMAVDKLSAPDRARVAGMVPTAAPGALPAAPSPAGKPLNEVTEKLSDPDAGIRKSAIQDLGSRGPAAAAAMPKIVKRLEVLCGSSLGLARGITPGGSNGLTGVAMMDVDDEALLLVQSAEKIQGANADAFYKTALKLELPLDTRDHIIGKVKALPEDRALGVLKDAIDKPASMGMWSAMDGALRSFGEKGNKIADRARRNL